MNSLTFEQFETIEQLKTIEQLQERNIFFGVGIDFDPIKILVEATHRSEKLEELRREKLEELRNDIGDELFSQLSEEEKQFIIETEGFVDFGYELTEEDLKRITKSIREEYEY